MVKYPAITRSGESCKGVVPPGTTYCTAHDPARSEERKRHAARAGRSKPNKELQDLKDRLQELAEDVVVGRVNRASAAVAGQLYNTVIRAVGVELEVKEQTDIFERLEELELLLEREKGDHRGYA